MRGRVAVSKVCECVIAQIAREMERECDSVVAREIERECESVVAREVERDSSGWGRGG